jgi:hypothetical protein
MNSLVPCPECSRHVRRNETACPFCGAAVIEAMARAPERAMPTTRLGRSALFVFAAASVGVAGCGGDTGTDRTGAGGANGTGAKGGNVGTGGEMAVPAYGLPAFTGGKPGTDTDAGDAGAPKGTGGTFSALYGLPPKL